MKQQKQYFYVQVINSRDDYPIYCGYSDNEWLAQQFAKSILKNKLLNVGMESEMSIFNYFGTLDGFHDEIRKRFRVVITGEDIIDIFPTTVDNNIIEMTSENIVSTCGNVLGGGFAAYAERFLLPLDNSKLIKILNLLLLGGVGFIRDDIDHRIKDIIIDVVEIMHQQDIVQSDTPFLNYGDSGMDIVRYGIMKGWYTVI